VVRLITLRALVILGLLLGLLSPVPAQAYHDAGTDPNEGDLDVDIRDTWRWVGVTPQGPRVVFKVRLYQGPPMNDGYTFRIYLDTRGDARRDFLVSFGSAPPPFCSVYEYRPFHQVGGCGLKSSAFSKRHLVGVRWYLLHPVTKRIPWYIHGWSVFSPESPDRAPDHGWYP
jgi:hypothetical protein